MLFQGIHSCIQLGQYLSELNVIELFTFEKFEYSQLQQEYCVVESLIVDKLLTPRAKSIIH